VWGLRWSLSARRGLEGGGGNAVVVVEGRDPGGICRSLERPSPTMPCARRADRAGRARGAHLHWQRTAEGKEAPPKKKTPPGGPGRVQKLAVERSPHTPQSPPHTCCPRFLQVCRIPRRSRLISDLRRAFQAVVECGACPAQRQMKTFCALALACHVVSCQPRQAVEPVPGANPPLPGPPPARCVFSTSSYSTLRRRADQPAGAVVTVTGLGPGVPPCATPWLPCPRRQPERRLHCGDRSRCVP